MSVCELPVHDVDLRRNLSAKLETQCVQSARNSMSSHGRFATLTRERDSVKTLSSAEKQGKSKNVLERNTLIEFEDMKKKSIIVTLKNYENILEITAQYAENSESMNGLNTMKRQVENTFGNPKTFGKTVMILFFYVKSVIEPFTGAWSISDYLGLICFLCPIPGDTVHVITVGKAVCGTAGCAEPASTAPTIGATAITLEEYQCSLYVCRDDLEDMVEDTITEINNSLASCLDECIDNAFIANLRGIGSTVDKGTAYITPAFIAETIGSVRNGTCEPVVVIMHPVVEARLMQNAQFVNASTYGDRSVITGGHILVYLGLDFVVVPKGSLVQNAPGTYHTLFLSRHAVHAAKKRNPTIETQYLVQTQRKYIYASVRFGKAGVCEDGIWWLLSGA